MKCSTSPFLQSSTSSTEARPLLNSPSSLYPIRNSVKILNRRDLDILRQQVIYEVDLTFRELRCAMNLRDHNQKFELWFEFENKLHFDPVCAQLEKLGFDPIVVPPSSSLRSSQKAVSRLVVEFSSEMHFNSTLKGKTFRVRHKSCAMSALFTKLCQLIYQ